MTNSIKRSHLAFLALVLIVSLLVGDAFTAMASERAPTVLPGQNACDGVLRTYGRCETGSSGGNLPINCCSINPETFPTVTSTVIFPVPFTNAPSTVDLNWQPGGTVQFGNAIESDVLTYSANGTRSGSTCIGCSKYTFPSVGSLSVVPSSTGWLTVTANDGFQYNNFPTMPSNVLLEMNVLANSNATANGRTFMIQGFDPFIDGVDCNVGMWENVGVGPTFLTNYGVGDIRGNLASLGPGGSATVNGTLFNDLWLGRGICGITDLQLRVVGTLTSGHETTTYNKILIAFFYTFDFYNVNVLSNSINTASFTVQITGPYGGGVTFNWKAYSESG